MKKDKGHQGDFSNPAKSAPNVKEITKDKKPQRKAEKKRKRMKRNSIVCIIVQGMVSLLFLGMLFTLGLLPFSYAAIVVLMVVLSFVITWLTQRRRRTGRIIGRIYSFFVVLFLLCGTLVMGMANYVLDEVTGAPYEAKEEKVDLMDMDAMFSIAEDPFCVYVQDMKEGNVNIKEAKDTQLLVAVNMQTHQLLKIATPGASFVTIPNVSNGKKEVLENAGEYGVEASMSAIGNLYETEVPYYLQVDTQWISYLKTLIIEDVSVELLEELAQDFINIESYVQTNMKKSEVQQLVQRWLKDRTTWNVETVNVTGIKTKNYTYSSPKKRILGVTPNEEKVKDIIGWLNLMEENEVLRGLNPIILK